MRPDVDMHRDPGKQMLVTVRSRENVRRKGSLFIMQHKVCLLLQDKAVRGGTYKITSVGVDTSRRSATFDQNEQGPVSATRN